MSVKFLLTRGVGKKIANIGGSNGKARSIQDSGSYEQNYTYGGGQSQPLR